MSRIRKRITYANVISTLALVLVVGGGSAIAASQFSKESIPNNALKKESIGPGKLTKAAKAALVGSPGAKGATGPAGSSGPAGPVGPAGAPGSALAFAHVNADGTLDAANSKNISAVSKLAALKGYYCVTASVPVRSVTVGGDGGLVGKIYNASFEDFVTSCPDPASASVEIYKPTGGGVDSAFFIVFN
jgi:hypothetical protein